MENKEDGTRSYRVVRTTPDGLSYARDIARRYGLDLEGILAEHEKDQITIMKKYIFLQKRCIFFMV